MDDLVNKVVKKLKERQKNNVTLSFDELVSPPNEKVFINNSCIILKNISIQFIKDLYILEGDNRWVSWTLDGIDLGVHFYFQINKNIVNFIPRYMILDWPINFITNNETLIVTSYNKIISRKEIATIPDNAIFIKVVNQKISNEAMDLCNEKNISLRIRTEENCIWLK